MASSQTLLSNINTGIISIRTSWNVYGKLTLIAILIVANLAGSTLGANLFRVVNRGGNENPTTSDEETIDGRVLYQIESLKNIEKHENFLRNRIRSARSINEAGPGSEADLNNTDTSYTPAAGIGVTESGSGHGNGSQDHGDGAVGHGDSTVGHGTGTESHGDGSGGHGTGSEGHGDTQGHGNDTEGHGEVERFKVAKLDFGYVKTYFMVSIFVLFAILAKIFFHMEKYVSKYVPESCLLILLGIIVGGILFVCGEKSYELNTTTFFLILLPPIILDAGYFMPARPFFDQLGTILLFAILGTLFNTLCLGFALWGIFEGGGFSRLESPLLLLDSLVFASLLAAVDPVAVLAVFESVHVNEILYIVVFGESLLNDGISVVLYHLFEGLSEIGAANILPVDVIAGVGSFFVIVFGAVGIGVLLAIMAGVISRFTRHVRVMEPLLVVVIGYLAFIVAEMFHLSGILSCTFCGIAMRKYVEVNYSNKSQITIRYILKMMATVCEIIIFMYLGISAVSDTHTWDTAFVLITLLLCLVFRAMGVLLLTYFANLIRVVKLNYIDQFIMSYGGLRGAIAFALVVLLDPHHFKHRKLFITSTVVVIYFTNLILGTTIEPLVNLLKVKKQVTRDLAVSEKIVYRLIDHVMAGIEDIADQQGHHLLRERFSYINNAFLKKIIAGKKNPQKRGFHVMSTYREANERDLTQTLRSSPSLTNLFRSLSQSDLANLTRATSLGQLARSPHSLVNLQIAAFGTGTLEGTDLSGDGSLTSKTSDSFHQSDSAINLVQMSPTNKKSPDISKSKHLALSNGSPMTANRPKGRYVQRGPSSHIYDNIPTGNVYTVQTSDSSNGSAGSHHGRSGIDNAGAAVIGYGDGGRKNSANAPSKKESSKHSSKDDEGGLVMISGGPRHDKEKAQEIVNRITDALIKTQNEGGQSNPAFDNKSDDDLPDDDDEKEMDDELAEQHGLRQRGGAGAVAGAEARVEEKSGGGRGAGTRGFAVTPAGDILVRPRSSVSGEAHHQTTARKSLDLTSGPSAVITVADERWRDAPGSRASAAGSATDHGKGELNKGDTEETAKARRGYLIDKF